MTSMVIWILGIGVSIAALVVTASLKQFYIHMAIAAVISVFVALASFSETRHVAEETGNRDAAVSSTLRHMGLVWTWAALALLVTYAFDILSWREWWQFFIGLFVMAGLSLFLSATLQKDASTGASDPTMLKVTRGFAIFILIAMVITMAGLMFDSKMWRFTTVAGNRRGSQDWAANNIFFFGALALSAIAVNTLNLTSRLRKAA